MFMLTFILLTKNRGATKLETVMRSNNLPFLVNIYYHKCVVQAMPAIMYQFSPQILALSGFGQLSF
jgi:hypothetical protein